MKTVTFNVLDYNELEALVQKVYGFSNGGGSVVDGLWVPNPLPEYSFPQVQECGNGTDFAWEGLIGAIDDYDEEDAKNIRGGVKVPDYSNILIMNCLIADGHLQPGNYLIQVSW